MRLAPHEHYLAIALALLALSLAALAPIVMPGCGAGGPRLPDAWDGRPSWEVWR